MNKLILLITLLALSGCAKIYSWELEYLYNMCNDYNGFNHAMVLNGNYSVHCNDGTQLYTPEEGNYGENK